MFYPCKKQSHMGQTHTDLRTGANSKSVLLSEQLTQINNYRTEGLLVHIFFSFMAPAVLAKHCSQPSSCPRFGRSSCDSQQPGVAVSPDRQPELCAPRRKAALLALSELTPLALQAHWGCGSIQNCLPGDILECSPWKELGNLKVFTVLLGRCEQQNKLSCKRGHLDKFILFPSNFWKVLYTCTTVDFLNIK